VWVENRSAKSWKIESFLHYPRSRIGDNDTDDQPAGPLWHDTALRTGYGIVDPFGLAKTTSWKNKTDRCVVGAVGR